MSDIELLQQEFALSAALLILEASSFGYRVTLGEAWRTPEQVAWDVAHGTGDAHSLHPERLAIDLNFFVMGTTILITDGSKLAAIGAWWKNLGPRYRWGGDFKSRPDGNHFSLSPDGIEA